MRGFRNSFTNFTTEHDSIRMSAHAFITHQSIYPSIHPSIRTSVHPSVHPSMHPPMRRHVHMHMHAACINKCMHPFTLSVPLQKPPKAGVALAGAQHGRRGDALVPATAPGATPKCRVRGYLGVYGFGLGFGVLEFFWGASGKLLVQKGFRGFRAKGSRGLGVRFRVR